MGGARGVGRGAALVATALCAFAPTATGAERELGDPTAAGQRFVPGEVIVAFEPGAGRSKRADARKAVGGEVGERLPLPAVQLLELGRRGGVRAAVRELEAQPGVRYAEPNLILRASATPDDPLYGELWGLNNTGQTVSGTAGTPDADIDAPQAWDVTTGDPAVTVAVVDSGVSYQHPDLAGNVWANPGETGAGKETNGIDDDGNGFVDDHVGWDFVGASRFANDPDNEPRDLNGHGTHVAGTIGALGNNGLGITGVNWDVGLMPVRALDASGEGSLADIAAAFDYAVDNEADVVNASVGAAGTSQVLEDAVTAPAAQDVLFVVAAGNDGSDNDATPVTPCNIAAANLICVAASDQDDALAGFSNFGDAAVDLAAPGTTILSAYPRDGSVEFPEDFEADFTGWTTGAIGTGVNTWGRTNEVPLFGQVWSLADSPGASYDPDSDSFARPTGPIDLTGESECTVDYRALLDMDEDPWVAPFTNGDLTDVEVFDGSWTPVVLLDGAGELSRTEDISMLDGRADAQLRFTIFADGDSEVDGGVHYDDIVVSCYAHGLAYLDGTSMATPQVAGIAALALSAAPTATVAELRAAILGGVDVKSSLAGVVATDGRLNARQSLELISSAPPPPPAPPPPSPPAIPPTQTLDRPPSLDIKGKRSQRLGRSVKIRVRCDERCTVSAKAKLKAGRNSAKLKPKPRALTLSRGESGKLKLALPAKARRLAKRTLNRDRKVVAKATVTAVDATGKSDRERFTIRLKG